MKNSKLRKVLLLACSAVLLVCLSVGATLAYLTSNAKVVNTFSVGNVTITMDEAKTNSDGTLDTTATGRVQANTYHLLPGHSYLKDPTIHVDANSEKCWLFVKVSNGIAPIEASTNNIAAQMAAHGWKLLAGSTEVYCRDSASEPGDNVAVFDSFTINGTADVSTYTSAQIIIQAYAVQADGFDTAAAAWAAAPSQWTF
ncbi:MAG: SipW-dependent-type signal peptide-containing protein [Aristaeellaceae bacterium]